MDTTLSDPLVGRVLDGRYHVESRLARGGMATVYEAVDSRLDRTVALKVMHPALAEDEDFVSRFIREAKSAARLSHPNVVAVYDQGADAGHVFLAMEHVPGRTLRDLLRERGQLTPRQALDVLEPVLAALGAAHHAGIVHRDVKPENVLLSDDGRVKVADFGLARAVSGATSHTSTTGVLMGTVAYLSPEQVERGVADPRSDVYAAGILLYEMLTGAKPYDGETAIQVAYRHVHDDVPAPSDVVPGLSPALDRLVARATSRDPDGRPVDATAFLAEVSQVRRGLADAELDIVGPGLATMPARADHTLVVPFTPTTPGTGARTPAANGVRRGDTGELPDLRRKRRGRGWIALLMVLILAAGLSLAAWFLAGPGSYTSTPSLLGLSQQEALAKARAGDFTLQVVGSEYDEQVAVGHVLSSSPDPNDQIRKGGTIEVVLSKGQERYGVPTVAGRSEEAARRAVEGKNLTVGKVTRRYSDTVDEGKVISSDPRAGTSVKRDTPVSLVVSKGVEPVAVPDVVGDRAADAQAILREAGLRASVTTREDDKVPAGEVISQSPRDGTVAKNSVVALVVSKGPPLVEVPRVIGQPIGEATRLLERAGFKVRAFGPGAGRVFNQNPSGGQARKGSTVTLFYFP